MEVKFIQKLITTPGWSTVKPVWEYIWVCRAGGNRYDRITFSFESLCNLYQLNPIQKA